MEWVRRDISDFSLAFFLFSHLCLCLCRFGGKVEEGETYTEAAVRELNEESGLIAEPHDLEHRGKLKFEFVNQQQEVESVLSVNLYTISEEKVQGKPLETEEMRPRWFEVFQGEQLALPFDKMWPDDIQVRISVFLLHLIA